MQLMTSWKTPKYFFLHPITRKKGLCSDIIFYSCQENIWSSSPNLDFSRMYPNILLLNGSWNWTVDIPERAVNKGKEILCSPLSSTVPTPLREPIWHSKFLTLELNVLKSFINFPSPALSANKAYSTALGLKLCSVWDLNLNAC